MSEENKVREASNQFYSGLNNMLAGDLGTLEGIWSHDDSVTTMHPVDGREVGWKAVKNSFAQFSELASNGKVDLQNQLIRVHGDFAFEVGTESGQLTLAGKDVTIKQRVTNIYKREGDSWKMIHHHADISPSMLEAISQVQVG